MPDVTPNAENRRTAQGRNVDEPLPVLPEDNEREAARTRGSLDAETAPGDTTTAGRGAGPAGTPARTTSAGEASLGETSADDLGARREAPAGGQAVAGRSAGAAGAAEERASLGQEVGAGDTSASEGRGRGRTAFGRDAGAGGASEEETPFGRNAAVSREAERGGPLAGSSTPAGRNVAESGAAGREATGAAGTSTAASTDASGATGGGHEDTPLLPHEEGDQLASRMRHAVVGFVDGPRDAVEEADHVLEELAARFTDAVNQRRRTLRGSWQTADSGKGKAASTADTEQLRLALKDYRELTERLLHA